MWTEQSKERLGCADPVGGEGEEWLLMGMEILFWGDEVF